MNLAMIRAITVKVLWALWYATWISAVMALIVAWIVVLALYGGG